MFSVKKIINNFCRTLSNLVSIKRIEYKNRRQHKTYNQFCNKTWNCVKYVQYAIGVKNGECHIWNSETKHIELKASYLNGDRQEPHYE